MGRPTMTCQRKGDVLALAGAIDEQAKLGDVVAQAQGGKLVLDLDGITFINSLGVREWIRMQAAAMAANVQVELRRVPRVLVHQLNIVVATRGNAIVTSFYGPYVCEHCEVEETMLLDVIKHGVDIARKIAPPLACPQCKKPMEFEAPPEIYFSFLTGG